MNRYSYLPNAVENTKLNLLKKSSENTGCDIYGKSE
jgi:hypothetical protein